MKNEKLFQHVIHNLSLYKILYSTTVKDLQSISYGERKCIFFSLSKSSAIFLKQDRKQEIYKTENQTLLERNIPSKYNIYFVLEGWVILKQLLTTEPRSSILKILKIQLVYFKAIELDNIFNQIRDVHPFYVATRREPRRGRRILSEVRGWGREACWVGPTLLLYLHQNRFKF